MTPIVQYKLELLKLVGQREDVAFTETDEILKERSRTKSNPHFFLYRDYHRIDLVYAFYYERTLIVFAELLEAQAIMMQGTTNLRCVRQQPLYPTTAEKLLFLLKCDNWVPTVLIKGPNFDKELERLKNDTSREIKATD